MSYTEAMLAERGAAMSPHPSLPPEITEALGRCWFGVVVEGQEMPRSVFLSNARDLSGAECWAAHKEIMAEASERNGGKPVVILRASDLRPIGGSL